MPINFVKALISIDNLKVTNLTQYTLLHIKNEAKVIFFWLFLNIYIKGLIFNFQYFVHYVTFNIHCTLDMDIYLHLCTIYTYIYVHNAYKCTQMYIYVHLNVQYKSVGIIVKKAPLTLGRAKLWFDSTKHMTQCTVTGYILLHLTPFWFDSTMHLN